MGRPHLGAGLFVGEQHLPTLVKDRVGVDRQMFSLLGTDFMEDNKERTGLKVLSAKHFSLEQFHKLE